MTQLNIAPIIWYKLFQETQDLGLNLQGRVCRMIFSAISQGYLKIGAPVPSSRFFAEYLGIARNTVVIAFQQLVTEKILESRYRSGHFVQVGFSISPPDACSEHIRGKIQYDWSNRLNRSLSQQNNLIKPVDWARYPFPFIYGQHDPENFPTAAWRECSLKALSAKDASLWAQDLTQQGDDIHLINAIRHHILPKRGIKADENEILLTVGSQNALYLLADLLINSQSVVGIEDPGYPDARNIFSLRTSYIKALAVDHDGVSPQSMVGCDYIYLTPGRQCPTGVSLSIQRRRQILALAETHDSIIIEDEYDAQMLAQNTTVPALKSQDQSGRVIYVGSLSKPIAPGLRLGYIVANAQLIDELRYLRRLMLRHPNLFIQRVFAFFIEMGYYHSMLRRQYQVHLERSDILLEAIQQYLPEWEINAANGGSACWVNTRSIDTKILAHQAKKRGVFIENGQTFFLYPNEENQTFLRMGISSICKSKIKEGVKQISMCL